MIPEFEVTILGNTSSIPVHGRNHTAQVVRFGQEFFLLDCGEATQIQMRRFKVKSSKINHIFISHLHGDHYLGLMGVLSSYNLAKRTKPLTIYGPQGLDEIITTQFRWSHIKLNYPLHFVQTDPDQAQKLVESPFWEVHSFPLFHRLPTTGFLIKERKRLRSLIKEKLQEHKLPLEAIQSLREGIPYTDEQGKHYSLEEFTHPESPLRSYAFCSDTCFDPRVAESVAGCNLLYHESTFMEADAHRAVETKHTTAKQAAEIAKLAQTKRLLLGHFSSRYANLEGMLAEAKTIFSESYLSEEGLTYPILSEYD